VKPIPNGKDSHETVSMCTGSLCQRMHWIKLGMFAWDVGKAMQRSCFANIVPEFDNPVVKGCLKSVIVTVLSIFKYI
jgi:hypothetical protein